MNTLTQFLSSAAGGAILGPILGFTGKLVHARWIRPKEVESEIALLTAQRNAKADAAGWEGFAASQKASTGLSDVPANTWPWVSSLYVLSEALTKFVRPGLTLGGVALVFWTYNTIDSATATYAQIEMAKEINFMAFTMWSWWFGERYIAKNRQPISLVPEKTK